MAIIGLQGARQRHVPLNPLEDGLDCSLEADPA